MTLSPIASSIDPPDLVPAIQPIGPPVDSLSTAPLPAAPVRSPLRLRALQGSAWTTVGYVVTQGLRFANSLILSRLLLPQDIGLMAMVAVFLLGIEMFSDLGTGPSIIHNRRGNRPEFLNTAWTMHVIRGFGIWIIACLGAWPASQWFNEPQLLWLIPICGFECVILGFNSTAMVFLNRQLALGRVTALEISQQVLTVTATVVFCLFVSRSVWALVFGNFIGVIFLTTVSHFLVRGHRNRFAWNRADAKSMYQFGRWIFISTGFSFLAMQADKLLLGNLLGAAAFGVYYYAVQLSTISLTFLKKMGVQVAFPTLAEIGRERPVELYGRLALVRMVLIGLAAVMLVPLIFFGSEIVRFLYPPQWHGAGWMLQVLAGGAIGAAVISSYNTALLAVGKTFFSMAMLISELTILIAASLYGYWLGGERGFVIGVACVQWLNYPIVALIMARQRLWQPQIDLPAFAITVLAVVASGVLTTSPTTPDMELGTADTSLVSMAQWLAIIAVGTIAAILGFLALTWWPAMAIKRRQIRAMRDRCSGKLLLTYDDGPDPLLTPRLLELLRRYDAKATFFMVGFRALRSPQICDLLVREGHDLGCHTHMHRKPWRVWPWRVASDVEIGYRNMDKWLRPNASFRPPFGKLTTWSWLVAKRRGAAVSFWTHDGCDTHPVLPDAGQVAQGIVNSQEDGAVVLLHNHDRGSERERYVIDLTEQLLLAARKHGLKVCTVSELAP
ncbi:MAG: oligosaccharide flippase family protein [Phycisphaerales bacterium]|nr:oligosaccharide flippase family protein [Phycisphaerales bacterium]